MYSTGEANQFSILSAWSIIRSYRQLFEQAIDTQGNIEPFLQQLDRYDARLIQQWELEQELGKDIVIQALQTGMLKDLKRDEIEQKIELLLDPEKTMSHGCISGIVSTFVLCHSDASLLGGVRSLSKAGQGLIRRSFDPFWAISAYIGSVENISLMLLASGQAWNHGALVALDQPPDKLSRWSPPVIESARQQARFCPKSALVGLATHNLGDAPKLQECVTRLYEILEPPITGPICLCRGQSTDDANIYHPPEP